MMGAAAGGWSIWRGCHRLYLVLAATWALGVLLLQRDLQAVDVFWILVILGTGYLLLHALHWAVRGFRRW